jgi:hypothetical protein
MPHTLHSAEVVVVSPTLHPDNIYEWRYNTEYAECI